MDTSDWKDVYMPYYMVVLEYLKIVLSWPVLGSAALVLIICWLRRPLDHLLRNISVRTPGGIEIQAQQAKPEPSEQEKPGTVSLDPEQQRELQEFIESLQEQLNLTVQEKEAVVQAASEEITKAWSSARSWEFMYLDRFLVPHTKLTLCQIHARQGQMTREYFCSLWPAFNFGTESEREAVLNALQTTGLLQQTGNMLTLTGKGRNFLAFLGFLLPHGR